VRLAACAWQDSNPRAAANPKIGELVGRRQLPAERERSREEWAVGSGGGLEGDGGGSGAAAATQRCRSPRKGPVLAAPAAALPKMTAR